MEDEPENAPELPDPMPEWRQEVFFSAPERLGEN
jgi:hypothetical protein